jgi:hypothetical protein
LNVAGAVIDDNGNYYVVVEGANYGAVVADAGGVEGT